jgi:hypothetical protein
MLRYFNSHAGSREEESFMPNEIGPVIGNWYYHLDDGERFEVVAIDEESGLIETQNFAGNVTVFDIDDWYTLDIEPHEPVSRSET